MVAKIDQLKWTDVDVIVGLESRGFILAPLLAIKLNAGFVPVRKKGRLPGVCKEIAYTLEYRSVRTLLLFYCFNNYFQVSFCAGCFGNPRRKHSSRPKSIGH